MEEDVSGGGNNVKEWLDADVVIDVANLRYWIAGKNRGDLGWPSLRLLHHSLQRYGVRARSFVAALPVQPFVGVGRSQNDFRDRRKKTREAAQENIGSSIAWVQTQRRDLKDLSIDLRIVDGATIGRGEQGVDELAAMAALDLLWKPTEQANASPRRGVILISRDRDVEVCHLVASGRPLFSLGVANVEGRSRAADIAARYGYRYLLFPRTVIQRLRVAGVDPLIQRSAYDEAIRRTCDEIDHELRGLTATPSKENGSESTRLMLAGSGGTPNPVSSPLPLVPQEPHEAPAESWETRRRQSTAERRTVCIADPVGLQRTGARALGLAALPGPDTLTRLVVDRLGFPPPMGLLCTVSDATGRSIASLKHWIDTNSKSIGTTGQRYLKAVKNTDDAYDELAAEVRRFGAVDRAELDLHIRPKGAESPGDHHLRLEEKEVTVLLAADVLWTLLHTEADIALVTDRALLQYVLENLPSIADEPDRKAWFRDEISRRVTRIGLHADPFATDGFVTVDGSEGRIPSAQPPEGLPHEVVLDGALAADLLGLSGRLHGPALESAVHRILAQGDVVWQAVRIERGDPWEGGLQLRVVSPDMPEEQELEVWLDRGLLVADELLQRLRRGIRDDELALFARIDPSRPCAIARLRQGVDSGDGILAEAVVLGPADGGATIDLDGDATTTDDRHFVPAGHGFTTYRPGMQVLVIRDEKSGRVLRLLGPNPDATQSALDGFDGLPRTGQLTGRLRARLRTDGPSAEEMALRTVPLMRWVESTPDARVLVVPTSDSEGYIISTALPHLQADHQAAGPG